MKKLSELSKLRAKNEIDNIMFNYLVSEQEKQITTQATVTASMPAFLERSLPPIDSFQQKSDMVSPPSSFSKTPVYNRTTSYLEMLQENSPNQYVSGNLLQRYRNNEQ